jgi:metacaspase-1
VVAYYFPSSHLKNARPKQSIQGAIMSKKAFLVGINNFIKPEYPSLRGCVNDTVAMRELLSSGYGFDDILVKQNRDATAQGIREGIAWLLNNCQPHDVRVFHFSSHGTQLPEASKNDEVDHLDEIIVPFDHDWKQPFRDNELSELFSKFPVGVNFTFIADCCHSGTIDKGLLDSNIDFAARYLTPPLGEYRKMLAIQRKRRKEVMRDGATEVELKNLLQNKFTSVDTDKHFLLAACEDRQTAADAFIDKAYNGAFTWALVQSVKEAGYNITYDEIESRVTNKLVRYYQSPQLQCRSGSSGTKFLEPIA